MLRKILTFYGISVNYLLTLFLYAASMLPQNLFCGYFCRQGGKFNTVCYVHVDERILSRLSYPGKTIYSSLCSNIGVNMEKILLTASTMTRLFPHLPSVANSNCVSTKHSKDKKYLISHSNKSERAKVLTLNTDLSLIEVKALVSGILQLRMDGASNKSFWLNFQNVSTVM